jgi:hypothetical protein
MAMITPYSELKVQARELGIKIPGKKAVALAEEIRLKKESLGQEAPKVVEKVLTAAKESPKKEEFDTYVVVKGKMQVRKYSREDHGENFAELAGQFARKKGYGLIGMISNKGIACPNCGHVFTPTRK